jgi:hypothetical protein
MCTENPVCLGGTVLGGYTAVERGSECSDPRRVGVQEEVGPPVDVASSLTRTKLGWSAYFAA